MRRFKLSLDTSNWASFHMWRIAIARKTLTGAPGMLDNRGVWVPLFWRFYWLRHRDA